MLSMNKCVKCNIEVRDESAVCPLCKRVLSRDNVLEGPSRSVMYPYYKHTVKKLKFATRITVFSAIVAELIVVLVSLKIGLDLKYAILAAAGLAFGCFSLIYSTSLNKSLQRKIVVELILAQVLLLVIDSMFDFKEWSLHYGLPGVVVGVDIAMLVLIIVNYTVWVEYLYSIIWILFDSIICMVLCFIFGDKFPLYAIIAVAVTAVFLGGLIVVGDKQAHSELHRRFHF